jgi:hypothetical protein
MALPDIFSQETTDKIVARIHQLQATTTPQWGKMNVAQMLAHCNVTYEMIYDDIHPKPNAIMRFVLKTLVKSKVVGTAPYPQGGRTAPQFIINDTKDFEKEKQRLIDYIITTQSLGATYFDLKESHSFGRLSTTEWNNMLYKHLEHHLTQFGV